MCERNTILWRTDSERVCMLKTASFPPPLARLLLSPLTSVFQTHFYAC